MEKDAKLAALTTLKQEADACTDCPLHQGKRRAVLYRGNPGARLVLIGEAPSAADHARQLPFSGPAGQLLDKIFASVGLDTNRDLLLTNAVMHNPPDDRKPHANELEACRPYWRRVLAIVEPRILVLCGGYALKTYFRRKGEASISTARGQWWEEPGHAVTAIFHPAYLLRVTGREPGSPKHLMWLDVQEIRRRYDSLAAD